MEAAPNAIPKPRLNPRARLAQKMSFGEYIGTKSDITITKPLASPNIKQIGNMKIRYSHALADSMSKYIRRFFTGF
ncbi:MAG: hypothetical protein WBL44_10785 [Nitrososphaeraceae archaeon]|jgi:hypothetical protein